MKQNIKSPLAIDSKAKFLRRVDKKLLIKKYDDLGLDTRYLLNDVEEISIFECLKTSYKFYYPYNISGGSRFYEDFQEYVEE